MNPTAIATVDSRIVATLRLVLAISALLIVVVDPVNPEPLSAAIALTLSLYTAYSVVLHASVRRSPAVLQAFCGWTHWADLAWYILLIALSGGAVSIFFFFLFFAILVASFRHGYREGLRVTTVAAALFTLVGLVVAPQDPHFELNRFLLQPIYLVVFGYMIAYWGGLELTLKRRFALLKDVTRLANPRFGVDRTTGWVMEHVRSFYDAERCILVVEDPERGGHLLRRADRSDPERAMRAEVLPPELARQLLACAPDLAIVYRHRPRWGRPQVTSHAPDGGTLARTDEGRQRAAATLAATLAAEAFISVPLRSHGVSIGRLYVAAARPDAFSASDLEFLPQLLDHFMPAVEQIRLVDRLASDAAEVERQRIAHDLHDSVIQPYIGLQIGLRAIEQKLMAGETRVSGDVRRLIDQISAVIADLRSYMGELKTPGAQEQLLVASMRRFVDTFAAHTGIDVQLNVAGDLQLSDRLTAEVFQMMTEGLSNVRRHTRAMRAGVLVTRRENHLVLRIEDDGVGEAMPGIFTPRSITARATALGGQVQVGSREAGGSAVIVEVPL